MTRRTIDFVGLAAALLDRAHALVPQWLPSGVERNGRWYVGDFDGGPGESANVNLATGQWIDNAAPDDDKGGDLISLYARLHGLNNGQAALQLMDLMGWQHYEPERLALQAPARETDAQPQADDGLIPAPGPAARPEPKPKRPPRWRPIVPVPKHAPAPEFKFGYKDAKRGNAWVELQATRTWEYRFEGELYGHVARFERVNSDGQLVKDTVALTWCENLEDGRGTCRWHWKQWEEPRPLYVPAALLSADLSLPVVVVEGEKCAQAGHELLGHEFDFISWPGGCKAWALARWSMIMGRKVILWPDCDAKRERLTKAEREQSLSPEGKPILPEAKQPGVQAMVHIGTLLMSDHGCEVTICRLPKPGAVPDGWDIADAIAEGWDAGHVRDFLRSAVPFVPVSDEARAKTESTRSTAGAEEVDDGSGWRGKLLLASTGAIKPVRENVVLALDGAPRPNGTRLAGVPEAAGVLAFNDFTNDVIKLKPAPWGSPEGVWLESDELEMGDWLAREHWLPPMSRQTLEEAVSMVARRHRYHPARERILAQHGLWDGEKRLERWLAECCRKEGMGLSDDPHQKYLARVGTWLIMAICQRVLQPGCKFDYMVILEGGQGLGKSTLCRLLGMEWFADTGLVLGDKDSYQNLQGVLVYEWGELDSLTKAEVTKVKQFVSSQKDRFRASFDRRPKDYPRQVVFIGTTNESHYLSDPTGNRRFWPVKVTRFIDLDWVRANLEQMFAEALHYLEAGERFHPNQAEQRQLFDPQQLERTIENALESAIRKFLYDEQQKVAHHGINGSLVNEITLSELLNYLGISVDKQTTALTKQASTALGRMGWERGRAKGQRADKWRPWVYLRPAERSETAPAPDGAGAPTNRPDAGHYTSEAEDEACPF